jgi:hypothetical protein
VGVAHGYYGSGRWPGIWTQLNHLLYWRSVKSEMQKYYNTRNRPLYE